MKKLFEIYLVLFLNSIHTTVVTLEQAFGYQVTTGRPREKTKEIVPRFDKEIQLICM